MAILTDGPAMAADGGDIRDFIAANHAADIRQLQMLAAIVVAVGVVVLLIRLAPRIKRRIVTSLRGAPRMPDPLTRPD